MMTDKQFKARWKSHEENLLNQYIQKFWRETYVAALGAGHMDPKEWADEAVVHYIEALAYLEVSDD
jgi:hypothetical protein